MVEKMINRETAKEILKNRDKIMFETEELALSVGFNSANCIKSNNIHADYNVDKVIQQLEEKISSYELCVETAIKEIDKNPQNVSTFEICSLHNNRGYLNGLKKAIEIVKSGGNVVGQKGEHE